MNALGVFFTLIIVLWVASASRKGAVLALLAGVCYVTQGQQILIFGFHFTAIRLIVLIALLRIFARQEMRGIKLTPIDIAVLGYAFSTAILNILRVGTSKVLVYQLGCTYDIVLSYWIFRCLIKDWTELHELLPKIAWLVVPLGICFIIEGVTGQNVFAAMGGQGWEGMMRGDRLRCMASFRGPHTAGIFGATLMPLFLSLFLILKHRVAGTAGLLASTAMTYFSNSSGPLLAYLCCLLALSFWPMRNKMKQVRWGIVAGLVALALVMKAPIWYIFAKISDVVGGDGWSRSYLMEQSFRHISRWWLMGTDHTADWASTTMEWGGADICNQYVSAAAGGGLIALIFFILIPVRSFRYLGLALREARQEDPLAEKFFWALGCILFAHVVAIFSITYFDQMNVVWWGFLAIVSTTTSAYALQARSLAPVEEPVQADATLCSNVDNPV